MDELQTSKLLTMASAADGREVETPTVLMWHDVIGHLEYDLAIDAMRACLKDDSIYGKFQPKDLLRHAEAIQRLRDRDKRKLNAGRKEEWHGDPKPANFEEMALAYNEQRYAQASGEPERIAAANRAVSEELGRYRQQLIDQGVDPDHPRYSYT